MNNKENIFDLSKNYKEFIKGELQNNLIKFKKIFGDKFKIKYENFEIDVVLKEIKLVSGIKFFRMYYDIPYRKSDLFPFIIDFIDNINLKKNNFSYIAHIHRTDMISGTNIVKICLEINRILGAKKTILSDGTLIVCDKNNSELDLSFIKLLERGTTFYMKLGFEFEINTNINMYYRFINKNKLEKEVKRLLHNIRNIKTTNIIKEYENTLNLINKIIKDNYNKKFDIIYDSSNPSLTNEYYSENPKEKINSILYECKEVLDILNKYKNIDKFDKFYKVLIELFNNSCDKYSILLSYVVNNRRKKIIYDKYIINRKYILDFKYLYIYRDWYLFSYSF